jgi:hypothetical protein
MNHLLKPLCALALSLFLGACSSEVITSCEPRGSVTPFCGTIMPEDLEPLENGRGIIVSEYGDSGHREGILSWFQPDSDTGFVKLVDSSSVTRGASNENWGAQDCTAPPTLSPHGIHLSERGEQLQLLVVNHSEREQVLFYAVTPGADSNTAPDLVWRGCVTFPDYAVLNDVAALPDGGFAVTHMYDRASKAWSELSSLLGLNNGHVWRWRPGLEPTVMANTSARLPNGIEVAHDGKSIWVNNYIDQEVRQYDLASEASLKAIEVPNIDNSAWLPDGRLLLASHLSPFGMAPCFGLTSGSCGSPYELVAVDTEAGTSTILYASEEGEPFGPATVAIEYQGNLYAGSFSGDRLVKITLPK